MSADKSSISKSKDLSVKSKAKLKGAFSLTDLKNDTFKSYGKYYEEKNK
jgi:alpha-1,4-galacturonosyltransferase